jgi:pimeloyl-ACP methyl ester carboxylesterase
MSNQQFKTVTIKEWIFFIAKPEIKTSQRFYYSMASPSSSHMYRDLINDLSADYHLIAPDYPGFGQSDSPSTAIYQYSFNNLASTVNSFTEELGLEKFSLYMHDYGGPVGLRIATRRPESIQALIVQNANAYAEGLGNALQPLVAYIQNENEETEKGARSFLSADAIKWLYTNGAENASKISPDSYTLDQSYIARPGNDEIQLALFRNYGTNISLYETWQSYFRTYQPPTLVISGKK